MSAVTSPDGFQTTVVRMPAPGVPGDFAGANIKANVIGGPGAWVAPPSGTLIGVMAYANPATGYATNYFQPSSFQGFVHREGQAIITPFLAFYGQQIPSGDMVTVMNFGEFWGLFEGGASIGNVVYANPVTGALSGGASGQSVTVTGGAGTVAGGVLTVTTAPTSGTYAVGQIVSMAGLPPGTYSTAITIDTVAPPTNGALTATSGGTLAATTYYVRSTWVTASGQTTGATETSLAVAADNVLNVAAPSSPPANATGWNVYVSTSSGTETLQNSTPLGTTTAWVEPTTGLVAGASLPSSNTATFDTITLANADSATIPAVSTATSFTAYGQQATPFTVLQNVPSPATFTASLAQPASGAAFGVLTVTAVASGTIVPGQWISATGLPAHSNTEILEQTSGTPGGAGDYLTTNTYYTIASTSSFQAVTGAVGKISSIVTAAN